MDGLDYLWDCADELGRDGRLTVIVSSDFSRDPYYNSGVGKAHWPIDSYMVMEKMRLALIVLLAKQLKNRTRCGPTQKYLTHSALLAPS
jgi:hypothetical protein